METYYTEIIRKESGGNVKILVFGLLIVMLAMVFSCEPLDYSYVGDPGRNSFMVPSFGTSSTFLTPINVGGHDLSAGDLSFVLTWEIVGDFLPNQVNYADLDIWVVEQNGDSLSSTLESQSSDLGPTQSGGIIDATSDGRTAYTGRIFGPERAYWTDRTAPVGNYKYGVRYFAGTVRASYRFKVYFGRELVMEHKGEIEDPGVQNTPEGPRVSVGEVIFNG